MSHIFSVTLLRPCSLLVKYHYESYNCTSVRIGNVHSKKKGGRITGSLWIHQQTVYCIVFCSIVFYLLLSAFFSLLLLTHLAVWFSTPISHKQFLLFFFFSSQIFQMIFITLIYFSLVTIRSRLCLVIFSIYFDPFIKSYFH